MIEKTVRSRGPLRQAVLDVVQRYLRDRYLEAIRAPRRLVPPLCRTTAGRTGDAAIRPRSTQGAQPPQGGRIRMSKSITSPVKRQVCPVCVAQSGERRYVVKIERPARGLA